MIPAALELEVSVAGGFRGSIVEISEQGVTLELDGGSQFEVAYEEPVTVDGRTLPLGPPADAVSPGGPVFDALKKWRLERSRADEVPAYVVCHDATLADLSLDIAFIGVDGINAAWTGNGYGHGSRKRDRNGPEIVDITPDRGEHVTERGLTRVTARFRDDRSGVNASSVRLHIDGSLGRELIGGAVEV